MTRRRDVVLPLDPIGLRREEAAAFIGICSATFDRMARDGSMPRPHLIGTVLVWDASEITAAFKRLPRAGRAQGYPDHDEPSEPNGIDPINFRL